MMSSRSLAAVRAAYMGINVIYRLRVVVALNVITGFLLVLTDVLLPDLGWFDYWFSSWPLKIFLSVIFWLVSPWVYRMLDGRTNRPR